MLIVFHRAGVESFGNLRQLQPKYTTQIPFTDSIMLSRLYRPALGPLAAVNRHSRLAVPVRFLATVENTPRQMPDPRPRATPISHDRATFTIRVSHEPHVQRYVLILCIGWTSLQWEILWRQIQRLRGSGLHYLPRWLSRVIDRPLVSRSDLGLYATTDWQLRCAVLRPG